MQLPNTLKCQVLRLNIYNQTFKIQRDATPGTDQNLCHSTGSKIQIASISLKLPLGGLQQSSEPTLLKTSPANMHRICGTVRQICKLPSVYF